MDTMHNREDELRRRIMRRVWGIYVMRRLTGVQARVVILAVAAFAVLSSVSVSHVIKNALQVQGLPAFLNFSISAVERTSLLVQLCLILGMLIVVWTARDLFRGSQETALSS